MSEVQGVPAAPDASPRPGSGVRRIARGAAWNWIGIAIAGGVGFFLSPYVVRHLGSTSYGVWVLVNSLVLYMAVLDLGIRGAVVRFVSADQPHGRHGDASDAVSAALWFRIWLGGLVLAVTVVLALVATRLFDIPEALHQATRIAILLSGTNLILSLGFGVFSGVLNALHRFDLLNIAGIGQALLNAAGVVVLLAYGHGIASLALWQLVVGLMNSAFLCRAAFLIYPELRLRWRPPGRALVRKFGSYSLYLFMLAAAGRVIYYTDNVIIGAMLPISAVTLYAIGFAPTQYLGQLLASVSVTLLPVASGLAAGDNTEQLRRLLLQGTRAVMAIALPLILGLLIRGKTFIALWMGPEYGEPSGQVLQVLMLSWLFLAGNSCAANVVYGLSKHKPMALWTIPEALANLGLSLLLVRRWGVIGAAWGTVLPSLIVTGIIWPRYTAAVVELPLRRYYVEAYLRPAVALIPFAAACLLAERWWPARHLAGFFLQMATLLPLAVLGMALVFRPELTAFHRARNRVPRSPAA